MSLGPLSCVILRLAARLEFDCAAFTSAFTGDIGLFNSNSRIDAFAHIINCHSRDCGRCECLDINAGFVGGACAGLDVDESLLAIDLKLKVNMGHGKWMTKWDKLWGLFRCHNAGNLRHLQDASLRYLMVLDKLCGAR